jgi:hypothetical protein
MHALTDGQKARRIFAVAEHGTTRTATDEHGPESTRNDTEERG